MIRKEKQMIIGKILRLHFYCFLSFILLFFSAIFFIVTMADSWYEIGDFLFFGSLFTLFFGSTLAHLLYCFKLVIYFEWDSCEVRFYQLGNKIVHSKYEDISLIEEKNQTYWILFKNGSKLRVVKGFPVFKSEELKQEIQRIPGIKVHFLF